MAISFISQGTTPTGVATGTGTTSVTPALPGTLANGDIVLIYVGNKPDTVTPTTPASWNLLGTVAGGTGTTGADTGPVRVTVFWRIKDAGWSTMPAITLTGNSGAFAQAFVYRNPSGTWDVAAAGGADTSAGTAWSVTAASDPGFVTGDWAFVASTTPTDVAVGAQFASEAITATGVTFGTMTERAEQNTSSGNDVGGFVFDQPVSSGTSSAAPVVTATASGTTTNVAGPSLVVRLRDAFITVSTTDTAAINIAEDSGTGGPVADNTYTYEEGTNGVAVPSGSNGVVAAGASNIYSTAAAIHGSLGMQMGDATNSGSLGYASPAASFTASVYFKIHASTAGATVIASARNGSSHLIRLSGNGTTSRLELRDSGSTVYATSASTFVTDTLYRADFRIDNALTTSAAVTIRLFIGANAEGSVPDDILSGTIPVASVPSRFYWGSSTAVWVTYNDTVRLYNQINNWPTGYAATPTGNGVKVLVSTTDSCAVTIADASTVDTGSTTKSATEAPAVTIAETSSVAVTQPTTDNCAVTISETSSVAVTQPTTDTSAITISDASTVTGSSTSTDSCAITISDVSSVVIVTFASTTDACAVTITESSSVVITNAISTTDSCAVTIAESRTLAGSSTSTDTSAITIAEVSNPFANQPGSESTAVSISEASSVAITQATTDTCAITISDSSSVAVTTAVSTTDSCAVTISDASTSLSTLSRTDSCAVTITESSSVAITMSTTDTSAITIAETSSVSGTLSRTDSCAITITDNSSIATPFGIVDTQTATSAHVTTAVTCTTTCAIGDILIFKRAKEGDDIASLFSADVTSTGTAGVGLTWTRQVYVSEAGKSTVEIWTSSPASVAGSAVVSSGVTSVANYKSGVLENWRGAAPFDGSQAAISETGGDSSPPPPETLFGFNSFASYNGYTQGTSESSTTMFNRLVNDFGAFEYIKQFQSGFLPTNFSSDTQGINSGSCPANVVVQCFTWTHGSIASGSHDAALTTYINSVPSGKTVILCENEVDNHIGNNTDTTQWANYVADMDHLYDLVQSLSPAGTVEVWDCFMEFTLDPGTASNRQWRDFMTNPAKRHGYVWDNYWNNASTDTAGTTAIGYITAKMNHLGKTRWLIGETGDRRQEDSYTPAGNVGQSGHFASDSARATLLNNRISAVLAANPKPEAYIYFDLVGTTGDHRIVTMNGSGGPDVLTKAVLAGFMAAVA